MKVNYMVQFPDGQRIYGNDVFTNAQEAKDWRYLMHSQGCLCEIYWDTMTDSEQET